MRKWYQPLEHGETLQPIPWLHPKVIQYLENLIQPTWEICEHGSGGSTLWFAQRCKCVTAYEEKPKWQALMRELAPENAKVYSVGSFLPHEAKYDLLLIDGEPIEKRADWLAIAPVIVKRGGWVVLDNANWDFFDKAKGFLFEYADLIERFDGNEGGTQHLVTEFYRLRKGSE
jgi:predicted O-methyltransferase YrrM